MWDGVREGTIIVGTKVRSRSVGFEFGVERVKTQKLAQTCFGTRHTSPKKTLSGHRHSKSNTVYVFARLCVWENE
jgi:hypothetical protein